MARTYTGPIYDGDGHVLENKEGILAQLPRESPDGSGSRTARR